MAATTPLREALNQGISSGRLVDTKIVLYSHRDSSGRIYRPKALYTNSRILKTVPYFNDCGCTATLDIAYIKSHRLVLKCSSAISQSLDRGASRRNLTKTIVRRAMDICPIATSRMMKMINSPQSNTRPSQGPIHPILLGYWVRTIPSTRNTKRTLRRGK